MARLVIEPLKNVDRELGSVSVNIAADLALSTSQIQKISSYMSGRPAAAFSYSIDDESYNFVCDFQGTVTGVHPRTYEPTDSERVITLLDAGLHDDATSLLFSYSKPRAIKVALTVYLSLKNRDCSCGVSSAEFSKLIDRIVREEDSHQPKQG